MFPFVVLIINLRKLKQKISRRRRNENWRKKRLVKETVALGGLGLE